MKMDSRAQVKPKFECKDLAPQVVPGYTPEVKVEEYFLSKFEERLSKKRPEWDWLPLSPATELVAACRDLEVANRKLEEKWAEGKEKREQMDKQWEGLREKEMQLRESYTHFNKFVEDNRDKRERAERKIQQEKAVQEQREKEILELQEKLEDFTQIKKTLEKHVNKHKIYEDYLKTVVANTKEFSIVFDILNRYETLSAVRMELTEQQRKDLAALENAYNDTIRLTEEESRVMLGLNNQLADFQNHYDQAKAETLRWETALSHIKDTIAEESLELNQVRTSCWNMYREICQRKNMPVKLEKRDVEQQLVHIKHTIQELKKIADIACQRTNMEAASNKGACSNSHK